MYLFLYSSYGFAFAIWQKEYLQAFNTTALHTEVLKSSKCTQLAKSHSGPCPLSYTNDRSPVWSALKTDVTLMGGTLTSVRSRSKQNNLATLNERLCCWCRILISLNLLFYFYCNFKKHPCCFLFRMHQHNQWVILQEYNLKILCKRNFKILIRWCWCVISSTALNHICYMKFNTWLLFPLILVCWFQQ